jgi:hypothetical protein
MAEIGLCARPSTELRMTAARGFGLVLRDGVEHAGAGFCARPSTGLGMTAARGLGLVLRHGGDWLLHVCFDGLRITAVRGLGWR